MLKAHAYRRSIVLCAAVAFSVQRYALADNNPPPPTIFKNFPVTTSALPQQATAPIQKDISPSDFKIRLQNGGTIVLDGSPLRIGDPNFGAHTVSFVALDKLVLKNHASIVTNGNTLVLFVNELDSEDGSIISFEDADKKAATGADATSSGAAGNPGSPGIGGGNVSIHIVQALVGILHVDLHGQAGGNGGHGAAGVVGVQGGGGTPCQAGIVGFPPHPGCKHDGGQGGKGGVGSSGGTGGDGGTSGQGGTLFLFNVGTTSLPSTSYTFTADHGDPGVGGPGGAGGPGGPGGPGGDGNLFCHGGPTGPPGNAGPNGADGHTGTVNANGNLIAQNVDLTTAIEQAYNSTHDH